MRSLSPLVHLSIDRVIAVVVAVLLCLPMAANAQPDTVPEIPIDGPIGPATAEFVTDSLVRAAKQKAPLVILRLDTPGGLSASMRDIVKAILASPVPVIGYVAPSGARAASAGTYILYATNIAAMAPATNLGAATPINLMGGDSGDSKPATHPKTDQKENPKNTGSGSTNQASGRTPDLGNAATESRKQVADAEAYIRALAERRGRNAKWAVAAVRDASSLSAVQAKDKHVIDLVADSPQSLLKALDGRAIQIRGGRKVLQTNGLSIEQIAPGWRIRVLSAVTDPTVAYLLFMIGIVGLAAEAFNPGATLPGVVGGVSLLTALYAFHMLPIDLTGAALVLLGVVLIVAEAFVPSFGALGLGGLAALVFGSTMLMDTPGYGVSLAVIVAIAITAGLMLALLVWMFHRARQTRTETGIEGLIDRECTARHDFDRIGRVWLHGESWRAETTVPVVAGQKLRVTAVDGLTVSVQPEESTYAVSED